VPPAIARRRACWRIWSRFVSRPARAASGGAPAEGGGKEEGGCTSGDTVTPGPEVRALVGLTGAGSGAGVFCKTSGGADQSVPTGAWIGLGAVPRAAALVLPATARRRASRRTWSRFVA